MLQKYTMNMNGLTTSDTGMLKAIEGLWKNKSRWLKTSERRQFSTELKNSWINEDLSIDFEKVGKHIESSFEKNTKADCNDGTKVLNDSKKATIMLLKKSNPKLTNNEIAEKVGAHVTAVRRVLSKGKYMLKGTDVFKEQLVEANNMIVSHGKDIILDGIMSWNIKVNSYADLKALHSILDEAFKQNQLLTWWATENKAIEIVIHKPE